MRIVARLIIGVAVVLILTGAALYVLRKPIAEAAVEQVLVRQRLDRPSVKVVDVGLSRLTLGELRAGGDASRTDLALEGVTLEYDPVALILHGKFTSVAIEHGRVSISANEDGTVEIAGWNRDPDASSGPLPFAHIVITQLDIVTLTPKGPALFDLSGEFDAARGGGFDLSFTSDSAGFSTASLHDASGVLNFQLKPDGAIELGGAVKGSVATPIGAIDDLASDVSGSLASWRSFLGEGVRELSGAVEVVLRSSTIETAAAPALAPLASGSAGIGQIDVGGSFRAEFSGGAFSLSLVGDELALKADQGDLLILRQSGASIYQRKSGVQETSFTALFDARAAKGESTFAASSEDGGPWLINGNASIERLEAAGAKIEGVEGKFEGAYDKGRFVGEADAVSYLAGAQIGRLRISDAPAASALSLTIDMNEKLLTATPKEGACAHVERASILMDGQDMQASVRTASFCPEDAPLVSISWDEDPLTKIEGALDAKSAFYRLGRTVFEGAPPHVDFQLTYKPALQTTHIAGDLSDGRAILNSAFVLSETKGRFSADIVGERLSANAALSSMKVAQNADLEMVAPVSVSGVAQLASEAATFDFNVSTPRGARLGRGEGAHNTATGVGEAVFDSGLIEFAFGLQPDRLIPALKGVVSGASGSTEGKATFSWSPNNLETAAAIKLDNVSFRGPGVAVTRTEGVSGDLVFSSLSPVSTAGEQTLSIAKIDLDALKLENGAMRFSLPGDNTLQIVEAEFPWFGGTIGAYDSSMSIAGQSETTMQIDNVDLSGVLAYIDVEGLSGDGTIEGVLPLTFEDGKARINNGIVSSKGPGVIRYQGKATNAAAQSNEQSALAFEVLRELRFDKLSATLDGPLDGTIGFNILFEGRSDIPVRTGKATQRVDSPVKYRITINAPLLSLIEQAILSTDVKLQIERARQGETEAIEGRN